MDKARQVRGLGVSRALAVVVVLLASLVAGGGASGLGACSSGGNKMKTSTFTLTGNATFTADVQ